jgi:hypothetical protein
MLDSQHKTTMRWAPTITRKVVLDSVAVVDIILLVGPC